MKYFRYLTISGLLFVCIAFRGFAQDTIRLTLDDAEKQFIQKNLLLLAQKYNIEASKALIIQAGLIHNPNVSYEQMLVNRENGFLPFPNDQRALQVSQLFMLANKRKKQVELAKINSEISEYAFFDLLRSLSVQLRTTFFDIYFNEQSQKMYVEEIVTLKNLVTQYKSQFDKGNVALKEVIRLQSFLFDLENELGDLQTQVTEKQADFRTLLGETSNQFLLVQLDKNQIDTSGVANLTIQNLIGIAQENRFDLKIQEASIRLATANLSFQKALAVPDMSVSLQYNKYAGYGTDYLGVIVGIDLPFFNKNQGNIKAAEYQIEANKKYYAQTDITLQNEVLRTYAKSVQTDRLYKQFDKSFLPNFDKLKEGEVSSYLKRNVSLLEFVDFYESYKNSVIQMNKLQNSRIRAFEELNFAVGKKVFNY